MAANIPLNLVWLLSICCFFASSQEIKNDICVENPNSDACQQISRGANPWKCTKHIKSSVDCILKIDLNETQFTVVRAEEALLAAPLVSDNVVVIGEIIPEHAPYQTVVVVQTPYNGTFENLKGKKFCHPGFKRDEMATRYVLEEFESKIIALNSSYCNTADSITLVEKRIRAVANFFGSSCRPGAWTESDELDVQLQSKYYSLCKLCGPEKCGLTYKLPFNDTLSCLTQNGGEIALTTLNDALVFFNSSSNAANFQFLCPNGSVVNSSTPCVWTKQLNKLIVSNSEFANISNSYIQTNLKSHITGFDTQSLQDAIVESLEIILGLEKSDKINLINPVPLKLFVQESRTIPSAENSTQCGLTVKWCTLNDKEQQKCLWLQQAALNVGLQPVIECVKSSDNDTLSCLNDIQSLRADIAFTDVNYGYTALKKGLTVVAYPETDVAQLSSILIVVRNDTNETKSLSDLKGKRACFPEYGGKEWLAFVDTLRTKRIMDNSCDYGKIFSDFVGDSCVPGAHSDEYAIMNANQDKLCQLCVPSTIDVRVAKYCNADALNKYYGSDGSLRCLVDNITDYAVITKNDVIQYANSSNSFRVLSKNGSLSERTGIYVDENAPLTILTAGEVVARNDSLKRGDIILLLRAIEQEFGQNLRKTFKAFDSFNSTKDLLFPDSTPGLTFGGTKIKYVENFKTLLSNSEKCIVDPASGAINFIPSTIIMMIFACVILRF